LNYFSFRFYRRYTTEKQWYRSNRLPGIASEPILVERGCPVLTQTELWGRPEAIYGEKHVR